MYLLIGAIISVILTIPSYWWFSFDKISPWYSFILIPICITYFIIYINIYWVYLLIHIHKYKGKQFVGKVSTYNLSHVRSLSSFLVLLQGLFVKRKGFKDITKEPGLILFNHVSDYDAWVLYKLIRGRYALVGKKALLKIPVIGSLSSSIGTLYASDEKEENMLMVDQAVNYITEQKTSVVIAPEGTRDFTGEIRPFKHGGFNIALRCKCPITLVAFTNMQEAAKKKRKKFIKINVEVFDKIMHEEYENMSAGELAELCEKKYKKFLGQL